MHKDTKAALERLERELLAEEKPDLADDDLDLLIDGILFDDEEEDEAYIPRNSDDLRAYNSDRTDRYQDNDDNEDFEEPETGRGELWFSLVMLGLICLTMIGWAVSLL